MSSLSSSCSSASETKSNIITQIEPLKDNATLSQFTQRLIDSDILVKWEQNENTNVDRYNQIKNELIRIIHHNNNTATIQPRSLYCWIEPQRIIDKIAFEFEYKLVVYYKQDLYYSLFHIAFSQIQELHQLAYKSKCFPIRGYPSVHSDITQYKTEFRSKELVQDMHQEQKYMLLPYKLKHNGPGRKTFTFNTKREAQTHHLKYFGEILCKLFNCPTFAIQNTLYNILSKSTDENDEKNDEEQQAELVRKYICKDLQSFIKHKAFQRLSEWRHNLKFLIRKYVDSQNKNDKDILKFGIPSNGNPRKGSSKTKWKRLQNQQFLCDITFYSVMVVSCSGTNTIGDHWAVIFEGKYHLLILEYFLDGKSQDDYGFVSFKLIPNNIIGQRVCWYSSCASRRNKYINSELFNDRWSTLRKTFLPKTFGKVVTFNYIHNVVKIWMSKPEYYMTTNNCQQFARNIYAVFDKKEAKYLNVKFDHRKMTLFVPSGPIGDGLKEGVSMEMFVEQTKKEIEYKEEQTLDDFEDIVTNLGLNPFVYDEDEQQNNIINISQNNKSQKWLNQNGNDIQEQNNDEVKYDEETLQNKQIAIKLLIEWRIPEWRINEIVSKMIIENVIKVEDWQDIVDDQEFLVQILGFTGPHSKRFKREYQTYKSPQSNCNKIIIQKSV